MSLEEEKTWFEEKTSYEERISKLQLYFYYFSDDDNRNFTALLDKLSALKEDESFDEIKNEIEKYETQLNRFKAIYQYPYYLIKPSTVIRLGDGLKRILQLSYNSTVSFGSMISQIVNNQVGWESLYNDYITGALSGEVKINTSKPIRDYAFYNFSEITAISAPFTTGTGKSAFVGCNKLKTFYAPEAKAYDAGFNEISTSISISADNLSSVFSNFQIENFTAGFDLKCINSTTKEITYEDWQSTNYVNYLSNRLNPGFTQNPFLKHLTLTGVCGIGDNAFASCTSLQTVNLTRPDLTVDIKLPEEKEEGEKTEEVEQLTGLVPTRDIGISAFANCGALSSISAPYFRKIGMYAFQNCSSLKEINFPKVVEISANAFENCTELTKIVMPLCNTMGINAFLNDTKIQYLDLGVSTILANTFNTLSELTTVIMSLASTIAPLAFASTATISVSSSQQSSAVSEPDRWSQYAKKEHIKEISMSSLEDIGNYAFMKCAGFPAFIAPKASTIGVDAFYRCEKLQFAMIATSLIPSSIITKSINASAFEGCNNLKYIICPEVNYIYDGAFSDCASISNLYIPQGSYLGTSNAFFGMAGLKHLHIGKIALLQSQLAGCKAIEHLELPGCTNIYQGALDGFGIKYISIPQCTQIGVSAFNQAAKLQRIYLTSVTNIGNNAFAGCTNLKNVYLLNSSVTTIGTNPFPLPSEQGENSQDNHINFYVPSNLYASYQASWPAYAPYFIPFASWKNVEIYEKGLAKCVDIPVLKPNSETTTLNAAGVGCSQYITNPNAEVKDQIKGETDNYFTGFNLKTLFYKEEKDAIKEASIRRNRIIDFSSDTKPIDDFPALQDNEDYFTLINIKVDMQKIYRLPKARIIVELDKDKKIITDEESNYKAYYYYLYQNDIRCQFKPKSSKCQYISASFKKDEITLEEVKLWLIEDYGHKTFCEINIDNATVKGKKFVYVHEDEKMKDANGEIVKDGNGNEIIAHYKGTYKEEEDIKYLYHSTAIPEHEVDVTKPDPWEKITFNTEFNFFDTIDHYFYIDEDRGAGNFQLPEEE